MNTTVVKSLTKGVNQQKDDKTEQEMAAEVLLELGTEMTIATVEELLEEEMEIVIELEENEVEEGSPVQFHIPPPPDLAMRQKVKRQLFKD